MEKSQESLLTNVQIKIFNKGEIIFEEGSDSDNLLYLILSGEVQIVQKREGKQQRINSLKKGDFFGEIALLMNKGRSATALTSSSQLKVACFDKNSFIQETNKNVRLTFQISAHLIARIIELENQMKASSVPMPIDLASIDEALLRSIREKNLLLLNYLSRQHEVFLHGNKPVMIEGSKNNGELFFVSSGDVSIYFMRNQEEVEFMKLSKGDFFGLDAFQSLKPRNLSARIASKDGRLVFLPTRLLISTGQLQTEIFYNFFRALIYYHYCLEKNLFKGN